MSTRDRFHNEEGMTLVELLVSIVISGIIASAMAAAFFTVVHHRQPAEDRMSRSSDSEVLANYVAEDAQNSGDQSSGTPEVSLTDNGGCTDSSPPVSGSPSLIVRLKWLATTSSGGTVTNVVNYNQVGNTILRLYCSPTASTKVSDVTVAHSVASVTAACTPTDCGTTASGIKLSVTETLGSGDATAYSYTLPATFRKRPAGGVTPTPPTPINAALITLGGSGNGLDLGSAATRLTINGGGTILSNANIAMHDAGNLLGSPTIDQVGQTTCQVGSSCASYTQIPSPGVGDPYQSVTCPATDASGSPLQSRSSLSQGPGIYNSPVSVTGTTILAPGRYVFKAGFSRTGGGTVTGTGVLLCVDNGGSWTVGGGGSTSFSPETPASGTGPFAGVVLFQPKTNTSPMSLQGGGAVSYSGIVYAGGATVDLGGGSGLTATSVIAGTATMSGSSSGTLG